MYVCVYSWLKITSSNSSFYLEKMHIISIQKNYQNNIWFWLVYHHQLSNYATNMFQSILKYSLFLYISKINIRKLCVNLLTLNYITIGISTQQLKCLFHLDHQFCCIASDFSYSIVTLLSKWMASFCNRETTPWHHKENLIVGELVKFHKTKNLHFVLIYPCTYIELYGWSCPNLVIST